MNTRFHKKAPTKRISRSQSESMQFTQGVTGVSIF